MPQATRNRPPSAAVREVHVHWIDLEPFGFDERVVWKIKSGRKELVQVGASERDGGTRYPNGEIEFEFSLADFVNAWDTLSARKKGGASADEVEPYGPGATFGDLMVERYDRYDYHIVAPCGDNYPIRGGALKKLVETIRDMPVSAMP